MPRGVIKRHFLRRMHGEAKTIACVVSGVRASASDRSALIEFAKVAVFSEDTALAARYGAEGTGLGGAR
jgi:hypothetical protein